MAICIEADPRLYNEDASPVEIARTRVEAGPNTYTVTLRVVRGDEKGSLKSETVIYGRKSQGTRTRTRLRWQGQQHAQMTDPSSHQRGRPTKKKDRNCQTVINLVMSPRWGSTPRLTDWLTVSRNVTLTLNRDRIEWVSWDGSRRWLRRDDNEFSWELKVSLWREDFMCAIVSWYLERVTHWDCYNSCVKIRFRETNSGGCNGLRTLVFAAVTVQRGN
jgi:hypothetical protein